MHVSTELHGAIGEYARACASGNYDAMLKVVVEVLNNDEIMLTHPQCAEQKTRCRAGFRQGMCNLLFFRGESEDTKWILLQLTGFADAIITPDELVPITKAGSNNFIHEFYDMFRAGEYDDWFNRADNYGGVCLGQNNPFHFFYDQFINLTAILKEQSLGRPQVASGKGMYFLPDLPIGIDCIEMKESHYYFFPTVYGANERKKIDRLRYYAEARLMEDALASACPARMPDSDYDLVLWIGLTGQKRSWVEQVEGYSAIIRKLADNFPNMLVYMDGMTAPHGAKIKNLPDEEIATQIAEAIGNRVVLHSLVGLDYPEKIARCHSVDAFVANGGTGGFVPLRVCRKPGVLHSNQTLWTFSGDTYPDTIAMIKGNSVADSSVKPKRHDYVSYTIDWRDVYNRLVPIINTVKESSLKRITVPQQNCDEAPEDTGPIA